MTNLVSYTHHLLLLQGTAKKYYSSVVFLQSCTVIDIACELQKMELKWELLAVCVCVCVCVFVHMQFVCVCVCVKCMFRDTEMCFRHSHSCCITF